MLKVLFVLVGIIGRACTSRIQTTAVYEKILGYNLTYQTYSGYEDVDWYYSESQTSIYYSLWECSVRTFADHSVPLLIWLQGGPGKSSQFAAYEEVGPLGIGGDKKAFTAFENPWSWNFYAHLLFVDQPIGTGLSYSKVKNPTDTPTAAKHFVNFLSNFLKNTPLGLKNNPLYLAGEGYAGHFVPAFAEAINKNSSLGIKIAGVLLGGASVDPELQNNHYDSFLFSTGIVTPNGRDVAHSMENQAIVQIRNSKFSEATAFIENIFDSEIRTEKYQGMSSSNYRVYGKDSIESSYSLFLNQRKEDLGIPTGVSFQEDNSEIMKAFMGDTTQSYLGSLAYLAQASVKILIYNGQNDVQFNTAGVLNYLEHLNWKGGKFWRESQKAIWKQSGKVYGWIKKHDSLIFCLIKNSGHYIYENDQNSGKPAFYMIKNYFLNKW